MAASKTNSAQEKWAASDTHERDKLLREIGYSGSYAKIGWSKLPYLVKDNLTRKFGKG